MGSRNREVRSDEDTARSYDAEPEIVLMASEEQARPARARDPRAQDRYDESPGR